MGLHKAAGLATESSVHRARKICIGVRPHMPADNLGFQFDTFSVLKQEGF